MKACLAVLVVVTLVNLGHLTAAPARRIDLSEWRLTFAEEFDTLSVSARGPGTRWIAHTPFDMDFGDAAFADPEPGFPFTIVDGVLRIEARRGEDGRWRSGLLASADRQGGGFWQQYGYFEMRAKLPSGPGLWPAFWLVGTRLPHVSAEIDAMEHYGRFPGMYEATVHTWFRDGSERHTQVSRRIRIRPGSLYEEFRAYGVEVGAEWITFYLDHVEVARLPMPENHHQPMFILLNLALGGGWPIDQTPSPSVMEVDYVRAYSRR